ncbi:MAG: tetratricopeptide repeat protein [Acidobacteria bacterium]|nr:tetratricopeptide repeat protein [Acidobacteriota bacterium]
MPRVRRSSPWVASLLLGAALAGWAGRPSPAAQDDLAAAQALYRRKEFHEAAKLLLRHLDARPADYEALLLLGLSLEQSGDAAQAEKVFDEALRRRPDDGSTRLSLARTLYLQSRFDQAAESLEIARSQGAEPQRADYLAGLIEEERGDDEAALRFYRGAGSHADAPAKAAAALLRLGRPSEALETLREAPDSREVRYQRALALVALDRRDAAIAELRKASRHPQSKALLERLRALPAEDGAAGAREASEAARPQAVRFVERAEEAGLDVVLANSPTPEKHLPETMAGGVAIFDADGDGLLDLFFANGAATPSLEKTGPQYANRLYRNRGGLRFEDVTERSGLAGEGFSIGAAAADYDNDGDVDLFVAGVGRGRLYRNRGDGRFDEVSAAAGLADGAWSIGAAWFDYDRDGLLDLFVANYLQWDAASAPVCQDSRSGVRTYCHPKFFEPQPNRLYRNRGDGTFEDVTRASGVGSRPGKAMSVAVADVDDDGDPDVFVPNDAVPNFLFVNEGRNGFREAGLTAGVALKDDGKAVSAMGSAFGDVDGDGRPDLLFTALPGETFPHFHNEGEGLFLDRTYASRIGGLSRRLGGWGVALADFNNDGAADVFAAGGHVMDNVERFSSDAYQQPNALWLGLGDGTFVDGSAAAGLADRRAAHRGLAVADLDQDGRLDAVATTLGGRPELWRNETEPAGCWLRLRLRGVVSNRDGLGARVEVDGRVLENQSGGSYASSSHGPLHVGLGACDAPRAVRIRWPSGRSQTLSAPELNREIQVREPDE